ncbi:MAG: aminoacyl-tRNA hydrolase [Candidatus Magasanikbacteria bacterium]|nr:aminoacyl-tRNA hydrolase [Candidatus Magasanikbacteria bacterium]
MKLVVGLGNPGVEYSDTRHNVGFIAANMMAGKFGVSFSNNKKFNAEIAEAKIGRKKIILAKPLTFMNESGKSVQAIINFFKIKPSDIIVAHDDKDIALGEYKIQFNRSSAGHNGVQSIIDHLGTQNFFRLRLGIKPLKQISDTADYVLGKISKNEKQKLDEILPDATDKLLQSL